jgi:hypothetical protein
VPLTKRDRARNRYHPKVCRILRSRLSTVNNGCKLALLHYETIGILARVGITGPSSSLSMTEVWHNPYYWPPDRGRKLYPYWPKVH